MNSSVSGIKPSPLSHRLYLPVIANILFFLLLCYHRNSFHQNKNVSKIIQLLSQVICQNCPWCWDIEDKIHVDAYRIGGQKNRNMR